MRGVDGDSGAKTVFVPGSVCEVWMVTRHKAFNSRYRCFTAFNGFTFDLVKAVGEEFSNILFTVANRLQSLKLTDEETFVLKAYVIFFTGIPTSSFPS